MTINSNRITQIIAECSELSDLALEDVATVEIFAVQTLEGNHRINKCKNYLKIGDRDFSDNDRLIQTILPSNNPCSKYDPFIELYRKATRLVELESNYENAEPYVTSNYITGLSMHFGLDVNNILFLYYQPVILIHFDDVNVPGDRDYGIVRSKEYFVYNNNLNTFQQATDLSGKIRYKSSIKISHTDGNTSHHQPHNSGDVTSVIFSFQEIFSVLCDNDGCSLSIFNAIETDTDGKIWHTLLLAPEGVTPPYKLDADLTGVYANLAHLCPPNCKKTSAKIE